MIEATPQFLADWKVVDSIRVRCYLGTPTPFAAVEIGGDTKILTLTLTPQDWSDERVLSWRLGVEEGEEAVDRGIWDLAEPGEVDEQGWFKIVRAN